MASDSDGMSGCFSAHLTIDALITGSAPLNALAHLGRLCDFYREATKYSPLRQINGTVFQCPHLSFVAGHHMNYVSPTDFTDKKTVQNRACCQCGAQPKEVGMMLDSARGRVVRMFKCECGEQAWVYDPKQALSVGH